MASMTSIRFSRRLSNLLLCLLNQLNLFLLLIDYCVILLVDLLSILLTESDQFLQVLIWHWLPKVDLLVILDWYR